jgi:predicted RNA-binding Zn-ribbon protein involved in translation (DUF1610 family)
MERTKAIAEIKRQIPTFLQAAKNKGFVCPKCGNGSGRDGDGIIKDASDKNGLHYKCFKCGLYADVIELYGKFNGIRDFNEQLTGVGDYYVYISLRNENFVDYYVSKFKISIIDVITKISFDETIFEPMYGVQLKE